MLFLKGQETFETDTYLTQYNKKGLLKAWKKDCVILLTKMKGLKKMAEKIKRFIDCYIETETCNLRCHYCYIALQNRFRNKIVKFQHSKEEMRKALSQKRLGGPCMINFCAGGETLLSNEVLPVVKEFLEEGHYVTIVTNGTLTKRFEEMTSWPEELKNKLMIKFSFHYLEFKRLNILDKFLNNLILIKNNGISYSVEITPSDELSPYIDELKEWCMKNLGALCHSTIARDDRKPGIDILSEYSFDEYKKIWGQFDSDLFDYKSEIFYQPRKEYCYAGKWSFCLNLNSGVITQCYGAKELGNIFDNIDEPLPLEEIGYGCRLPHCFNGHAFLTLGNVPSLHSPTYAEVRNRVCTDGSEWLTPCMKSFIGSKLKESNKKAPLLKRLKAKQASKRKGKDTC